LNDKKYLVHACLEGPEAGVYYRGQGRIDNDDFTEISLPHYVDKIATNFTVQIAAMSNNLYYVSEVENNKFKVFGKNGSFYWVVYGQRTKIEVEPDIGSVSVKGEGPYKWI
jgi:hypothetical protein